MRRIRKARNRNFIVVLCSLIPNIYPAKIYSSLIPLSSSIVGRVFRYLIDLLRKDLLKFSFGWVALKCVEKKMVTMVARQGRQLQRYTSCGERLVVGCIPYKLKTDDPLIGGIDKMVQVLVISSQKGHGMMFPKGGWELDESMKQAALREAMEEAGVLGHLEGNLGSWMYKSNRNNAFYEGIMFPLNVTEELPYWPEMEVRKRSWVTVAEVRDGCPHAWMKEALESLLIRLERQKKAAIFNFHCMEKFIS